MARQYVIHNPLYLLYPMYFEKFREKFDKFLSTYISLVYVMDVEMDDTSKHYQQHALDLQEDYQVSHNMVY